MSNNDGLERVPVKVVITLTNGERFRGAIQVVRGRKLGETLNNTSRFLLVETSDGAPTYLSLDSIREIKSSQLPAADQISNATQKLDNANPLQILGLDAGFDRATLNETYRKLAKLYHPDNYANVRLPEEVRAYIADMAKRINMAVSELDNELKVREAEDQRQREMEAARGPVREFNARL